MIDILATQVMEIDIEHGIHYAGALMGIPLMSIKKEFQGKDVEHDGFSSAT